MEDWYKENREEFAAIEDEANAGSTDGKLTIYCEGNVSVYKLEMYDNLFDGGEEMNALIKTKFDSMFEEQRDTYINLIDNVSENCGIDASMISVHIDIFDPTTTDKPGYFIELRK